MSTDDREKLSYSERDRLRRERAAGHERPRGRQAELEAERGKRGALAEADAIFGGESATTGRPLAKAVRAAHGTAELPEACRAYVAEHGLPKSVDLLQIFIDTSDESLVVPALESLLEMKDKGRLEWTAGLKSQLRILADDPDDDVAGLSEDLLA